MLDSIRSSAQSFGVKVAFGIIILVFVFWGIGNFNDRDYSNVVAIVNGEPIVAQEFERAYLGAEEELLRNNPGMTREQLAKDHLGRRVLNDLIEAVLIQQEGRSAGMTATPLELRDAVGKMTVFQNEQGKFDPEAYRRLLESRRMSAADYEARLGNELMREKITGLVVDPVWVDPDEIRNHYDFLRETRDVDYIFVPASDFLAVANVDDAAVKNWYDANKNEFTVPATADISYITIRPEALVDPAAFSEAQALSWYEANKSQFIEPEQVKAAHVLVPVAEDAPEAEQTAAREKIDAAMKELATGKTFAEVADKFNGEGAAGPGGELGWILRDQTVPAFEEALFALEPGKVSEPVRTQYGWHLILAEEKKSGGEQPFAQVEAKVREALARESGVDKLHDALDTLIEANILGKSLEEAAAQFGLKAERSGPLEQAALVEKLGIKPEAAQSILSAPAGSPLDTALEAGPDVYLIAKVENVTPASIKPFEEVAADVTDILKKEKALELVMAAGAEKLRGLADQSDGKLASSELAMEQASNVEREGLVGKFLPLPELNQAIFETEVGKWLPKPYLGTSADGQGALLVRVNKVTPPDSVEYERVAGILGRAAAQERMSAIYNLFLQNLANKAKIEITNQAIIDRTSR